MLQGIPLHPLAVHFGIVLGLLAAAALVLSAVVPRFRRWLDWGLPLATVAGAVAIRVTSSLGAALQESAPQYQTELVSRHGEWGAQAGLASIGLGVMGVLLWLTTSPTARERWTARWPSWVTLVVQVLSVAVAIWTIVAITLAGHTGATSVWTG